MIELSFSILHRAARSSTTACRICAISPSPTPATRRPMPAQTTRLAPRSATCARAGAAGGPRPIRAEKKGRAARAPGAARRRTGSGRPRGTCRVGARRATRAQIIRPEDGLALGRHGRRVDELGPAARVDVLVDGAEDVVVGLPAPVRRPAEREIRQRVFELGDARERRVLARRRRGPRRGQQHLGPARRRLTPAPLRDAPPQRVARDPVVRRAPDRAQARAARALDQHRLDAGVAARRLPDQRQHARRLPRLVRERRLAPRPRVRAAAAAPPRSQAAARRRPPRPRPRRRRG